MKTERPMDWHREYDYLDSNNKRWVISYRLKRKMEMAKLVDKFWIELFQIDNENDNPNVSERYPKNMNEYFLSSLQMYEEGKEILKKKQLVKAK